MKDTEIKNFTLSLAGADTEEEVINILKTKGYWNDDSSWCEYGGDSMNYSIIGNQQSHADNALVEKLVNSVDAVLMRDCLIRDVKPEDNAAPQSIAEAQKKFFDIHNGKLSSINSRDRIKLAQNIFLVATGNKKNPSLSIIDKGEGQSPTRIPETILSLTKNNKNKIPFVQGKFGMGGSGVLRFCSPKNSLMLVISKRNHKIKANIDKEMYGEDNTRGLWGVTVVRREDPKSGEKNSHYTYLAPQGGILSFNADELPLLPGTDQEVLHESLRSGTFIKLYEYQVGSGLGPLIVFALYYRLALLMPDIALPITMVECREYKAHSYRTTLAGLSVRLDEDKSENLEPEFQKPSTGTITVEGQELGYSIYVFKKNKKENYAKKEGIVFSVNGQTQGFLQKNFFERKAVGMSYLSDSILVMVDCSRISRRKQEELFMPSRDRLANTAMSSSIEKELESIIKTHSGLRELQNRRRKEAIEDKLQDSKPLADVLENIIKKSPSLTSLFLHGKQISNPFNTESGAAEKKEFKGEQFPTYFTPTKTYTKEKPKHCSSNHQFRVQYETDAENNYFERDNNPGEFSLELNGEDIQNYSLNLYNGFATLNVNLPIEVKVGDTLCFKTKVDDINLTKPFNNEFFIVVDKEHKANKSEGKGNRKEPIEDEEGKNRRKKSRLDIPNVVEIRRDDWSKDEYKDFNLTGYSALKVRSVGEENGGYDFFINMDNLYLKNEMKSNTDKTNTAVLEARYRYGMVLLGLSILDFEENRHKSQEEYNGSDLNENGLSVPDQISRLTEAVSLTLLPMITSLGSSEFEA